MPEESAHRTEEMDETRAAKAPGAVTELGQGMPKRQKERPYGLEKKPKTTMRHSAGSRKALRINIENSRTSQMLSTVHQVNLKETKRTETRTKISLVRMTRSPKLTRKRRSTSMATFWIMSRASTPIHSSRTWPWACTNRYHNTYWRSRSRAPSSKSAWTRSTMTHELSSRHWRLWRDAAKSAP